MSFIYKDQEKAEQDLRIFSGMNRYEGIPLYLIFCFSRDGWEIVSKCPSNVGATECGH